MRIFKNTWFHRFAGKEGITDSELKDVVNKLEKGQADANLGGDVYKMRIARPGEGKSGGFRIIVLFRTKERTFFIYGFTKSDLGNISQKELKMSREVAKEYFLMASEQLEERIKSGRLIEILEV